MCIKELPLSQLVRETTKHENLEPLCVGGKTSAERFHKLALSAVHSHCITAKLFKEPHYLQLVLIFNTLSAGRWPPAPSEPPTRTTHTQTAAAAASLTVVIDGVGDDGAERSGALAAVVLQEDLNAQPHHVQVVLFRLQQLLAWNWRSHRRTTGVTNTHSCRTESIKREKQVAMLGKKRDDILQDGRVGLTLEKHMLILYWWNIDDNEAQSWWSCRLQ